jgi:hypothetical protein
MAASKNTQRVAGILTAMAMIVKPQCDEAAILASPCDSSSPANGGWIIILGSSIAFIDGTVVNVALPALHSGPRRDDSGSSLGALLLTRGALGDLTGARSCSPPVWRCSP